MQVNRTEKLNNDLEMQKDHNQVMPLGCQGLEVFSFLPTGPDMWDKKILYERPPLISCIMQEL